ncbi:MAG: Inner membrane protein YohD [Syntrophorhabdaceae bacterium PtaU1.Bin034]|jgi:membrane protein DedA with SNARE-associated domain|nr:MAG: Inner membrane protein YohD [Syntrophorhabdaceae bacterium PtaU1.Bin034]
MSVEQLISQYGYFALFLGVFLEGETVVIAAAFAAHQGYLKMPWVIAATFLGSIAGDHFYFFLGRTKGRAFVRNRPLWQLKIRKVQSLLESHPRLATVGFRFLYGLRTVTPFALGMSETRTSHFVVFDIIGAFFWSLAAGLFGFLFGSALEALFTDIREYERLILVGILAIGTGIWIAYQIRKRRLRRIAALSRPHDGKVQTNKSRWETGEWRRE